ncbi:MAG: hypothetical protein J0M02_19020, partial [Planctomycetes bacterium]|nr:hypothetical protein [Planctomycetota bacterium]
LALWIVCICLPAAEVAVWDPRDDTTTDRLILRRADWDALAGWLREAGLDVARVDGPAMCLPGGLDAARTPVLVMSAHHVPLGVEAAGRDAGQRAYIDYLDAGGIIIGLGTGQGQAVFGAAIAPEPAGGWRLSPPEPRFAWEISGLREAIGLRYVYDLERHDRGVRHEPSPLLRRYWRDAPVVTAQLRQVQHVPAQDGVAIHPLYASSDLDGSPLMPAIAVVRNGRRTAILAGHTGWWTAPAPAWFSDARTLGVALIRIALDLHAGTLELPAAPPRIADPGPDAVAPLRDRIPLGEIDPAEAAVLVRWGRFDGSGRELGRTGEALPARLDPGGEVLLPLPARSRSAWLRIRCAIRNDDAGITASADGVPLLCERLIAPGATGPVADPRTDPPIELTRCAFLPPGPAVGIRLSNPGSAPLWFDAVQLETRGPGGAGKVRIGLAAVAALPAELDQASLAKPSGELLDALERAGADRLERLPVHAYGSVPVWDRIAGRSAGDAMSRGVAMPIAVLGHGFPASGGSWTPERQALAVETAIARVLAAGTSQVAIVELAGIMPPAAAVIADYAALNGHAAVRTDLRLLAADARPLRGVYAAASQDASGVVTVVVSTCQADAPQRLSLAVPLPDARPRQARLRTAGRTTSPPCRQHGDAEAAWCELELDLDGRCVLSLEPR